MHANKCPINKQYCQSFSYFSEQRNSQAPIYGMFLKCLTPLQWLCIKKM